MYIALTKISIQLFSSNVHESYITGIILNLIKYYTVKNLFGNFANTVKNLLGKFLRKTI